MHLTRLPIYSVTPWPLRCFAKAPPSPTLVSSYATKALTPLPPYVRIDVACENKWKAGREREKGSESTTNGRVSQSGSGKVSESRGAVGGGSGAGIGSIEMVSLSMEQALW